MHRPIERRKLNEVVAEQIRQYILDLAGLPLRVAAPITPPWTP
jgi:hypothetical protein